MSNRVLIDDYHQLIHVSISSMKNGYFSQLLK